MSDRAVTGPADMTLVQLIAVVNLGELCQIQQSLGCGYVSSFFAYFFRALPKKVSYIQLQSLFQLDRGGLMVPQGADIVALQLGETTLQNMVDFHRPGFRYWVDVV